MFYRRVKFSNRGIPNQKTFRTKINSTKSYKLKTFKKRDAPDLCVVSALNRSLPEDVPLTHGAVIVFFKKSRKKTSKILILRM